MIALDSIVKKDTIMLSGNTGYREHASYLLASYLALQSRKHLTFFFLRN